MTFRVPSSGDLPQAIQRAFQSVLPLSGGSLSGNLTVSGTVSATLFSGSGASLTSLPAGSLTGTTLPASILASSLTSLGSLNTLNVNASTSTVWSTGGWFPAARLNNGVLMAAGSPTVYYWITGVAPNGQYYVGYNTASDGSQAPTYRIRLDTSSLNFTGVTNITVSSGEVLRLGATNPYVGFWDQGLGTRIGYLQGVNGSDIRMVSDAGSMFLGTGTLYVRDAALSTNRVTVSSTSITNYLVSEFSLAGTPTADGSGVIRCSSDGTRTGITIKSGSASNVIDYFMAFYDTANGATSVGSISSPVSSATTTYFTTSDYRLKCYDVPLTGSLERVRRLRPISFRWKNIEDSRVEEGFFAHEVQTVVPTAVSGDKDAVNDDGSIVAQQMELARLVPLLVGAVQELDNKVSYILERCNG